MSTFEAESPKLVGGQGEAGLIGEAVECADAERAATTLVAGEGDGVADAAVGEPAVVAAVKPLPPSCVEVAWRCQLSVHALTQGPGLLQRQLCAGGIEHLTYRGHTHAWD